MDFIGEHTVFQGLYPTATRWNTGTPATSVGVNMGKYDHACFIFYEGAGGAGTCTITMVAATDAAGTSPTAIGFRYRLCSTQDVWGDLTTVASTGYLTIAGANKMVAVEIDASELTAAKPYVCMVCTVGVTTAVAGGVMVIASEPRYIQQTPVTAIA